ncbi:hypothetical protein PRUPE_1G315500 [Prunus persica]|uniref:Uncharacterized protein n=1 Tax=Prunus persica TaxID=3760 RepID=A0A251R607_PRUPE|nr:hypothetical protein PRUPE_1G315500 [Prunus persica]
MPASSAASKRRSTPCPTTTMTTHRSPPPLPRVVSPSGTFSPPHTPCRSTPRPTCHRSPISNTRPPPSDP